MASIPLTDYAGIVAGQNGIDPSVFVKQIQQESGFNPSASNGSAQGIAQIQPGTAANPGYGVPSIVDRLDPYASLDFAAKYDAALLGASNGDYMGMLTKYGTLSNDPASSVGPNSDIYQSFGSIVANAENNTPSNQSTGSNTGGATYTDPMGNVTNQTDTDPQTNGAASGSASWLDSLKNWVTEGAVNWLSMLVGIILISIGVWSAAK